MTSEKPLRYLLTWPSEALLIGDRTFMGAVFARRHLCSCQRIGPSCSATSAPGFCRQPRAGRSFMSKHSSVRRQVPQTCHNPNLAIVETGRMQSYNPEYSK